MSEKLVGYKLLDGQNNVVQTWGGVWNSCPPVPNPIILPNGNHIHGVELNIDYNGYVLEPWMMEEPIIVPSLISDRQFFQQLAIMQLISKEEALAAVKTGDIPATIQTVINGLEDENLKFSATMLLSGATAFDRNHPMTLMLANYMGWTEEQLDYLWIEANKL